MSKSKLKLLAIVGGGLLLFGWMVTFERRNEVGTIKTSGSRFVSREYAPFVDVPLDTYIFSAEVEGVGSISMERGSAINFDPGTKVKVIYGRTLFMILAGQAPVVIAVERA